MAGMGYGDGHGWEETQGIRDPPGVSLERQPARYPRLRSCVARETASAAGPPLLDYSSAGLLAPPSPLTRTLFMSKDSEAPIPPASELFYSQLLKRTHTPLVGHPLLSQSREGNRPGEGSHCLSQD